MRSMIELLNSKLPAAAPPAAPAATPTLHQQQIAHAKQCFDEKATFDAAVAAAVEQVIAARDAAASPPLRAASYSSAAAPRAPAGFRVPALPPPPPPTPPAFSYMHSLSTDRLVPVKSATQNMIKCITIDLVPAGMNTQALAVASFIIAHDTRMDGFLKMDDPTFAEERRLGGAYAEWFVATDAMLANAILGLGSFDRSSTHVQNFISEFGQDAGLVSSGRALLKHFMRRLYNAESGFEEYQAEEDLKAFAPFTMGADEADSKKHGYGLVECYGRLPTTCLLLPPDLLKGQTRLLLNKLPDTMSEKRAVIKAFFQESRSGVPRWETLHAVIKDIALMLVPDAPLAPVVNAAFTPRGCWICAATAHSARDCTETCSECNFKFCPAAKPGTPRAPCAVNASAAPVAHKITNALGGRLPDVIFQGLLDRWQAKHPLTAHAGESRSEEEINIAEFEREQARYLQANSAVCSDNFEVNFVPRANPSICEDNDETDGVGLTPSSYAHSGRFCPPRPTALFLNGSFAGGDQAIPYAPSRHRTERPLDVPHCRTDPISKTSSSGSNWHRPSRHRYTARGHDCWPSTSFVVIYCIDTAELFIRMVHSIRWSRFTVETAHAPSSTRWPHW